MVCSTEQMHITNGAGNIENKQWILTFMYYWHSLTTSKMYTFHVFEFTSEKQMIVKKMNEPEYIQLKREAVKCAFCS